MYRETVYRWINIQLLILSVIKPKKECFIYGLLCKWVCVRATTVFTSRIFYICKTNVKFKIYIQTFCPQIYLTKSIL